MIENLAPIILFVYNRPEHTLECLEALSKNNLADRSKLYIFCDGVKKNSSDEQVFRNSKVKEIIRRKKWCKEVIIIESETNKGLANSIIQGVTKVIDKYNKVIILEDDLITSNYFLEFMNESLNFYKDEPKVFQISGYSFPVPSIKENSSSFFLPITSTWGWGTWKRTWDILDFECLDYTILKKDKKLANKFNLNGNYNYKKMFFKQMESNKISSWGIRFYWNAFKNNALVLYPDKSLVYNKGWDNSGNHNDSYILYPILNWNKNYKVKHFEKNISVNNDILNKLEKYIKKRTSFITKLSNVFLKFK